MTGSSSSFSSKKPRSDKDQSLLRLNYAVVAHLLKSLIAERFKRMARDEVLSKFISSRVDPAALVDHALHAEKEALDLAEVSLLKLVDSEHLKTEVERSAERIQGRLGELFGIDVFPSNKSKDLISARMRWLSERIVFYRKWMSLLESKSNPLELAKAAFYSRESFMRSLESIQNCDRDLADELVRSTPPLHRFMMKKQMEYELKSAEELWSEFAEEAFKKQAQLPD